ncbi:MAG: hypothetical protein JNL98_04090 [Bryobacterales bacterium]|nr:hypothetical protein [Bryobacterales bacterium]
MDEQPELPLRRVPAWVLLAPALIAAATVAAVLGLGRRPRFNAWWQVPATAFFWILLSCAAAGLMVYLVRRLARAPKGRRAFFAALVPVAATAAWFVPAAVFLRFHLISGAFFSIIASISVVRLYREFLGPPAMAQEAPAIQQRDMFLFPRPVSAFHQFIPSLIIAILLQWSFVAWHWRRGLWMVGLLSLALASLTMLLLRGQAVRKRRPAWSMAVATLMAALGLIPYFLPVPGIGWPFGWGGGSRNQQAKGQGRGEMFRDMHAGVILVAESKLQVTKLVAPVPSSYLSPLATESVGPLDIPFEGVYWFYRYPAKRPPEKSVILHGHPDTETFRAPDYHPLVMEGRQHLTRPVNLSCCSSIRVMIRNADRPPGSVEMELNLIDTLLEGRPLLALGREKVKSVAPVGGKSAPVRDQLTFRIPPSASIQRFDELQVRFHLGRKRAFRSAKIAIERFVLEPRRL